MLCPADKTLRILEALMSSTDEETSMRRMLESISAHLGLNAIFLYRDVPFTIPKNGIEQPSSFMTIPATSDPSVVDFNLVYGCILEEMKLSLKEDALCFSIRSSWEDMVIMMIKISGFQQTDLDLIRMLKNPLSQSIGLIENSKMYMNEIEEKNKMSRELKKLSNEMISAAYKEGVAENAVSVIHNVGNILTPVKSRLSGYLADQAENQPVALLKECLREHHAGNPQALDVMDEVISEIESTFSNINSEINFTLKQLDLAFDTFNVQQKYAKFKQGVVRKVNVSHLLDEVVALYKKDLDKFNIELKLDLKYRGEMFAEINSLHHLLSNAFLNSIESICERKKNENQLQGQLACILDKNNNNLLFKLEDNGLGIKNDDQNLLFKFGFTTKEEGNGFGLHNMANYVKKAGGQIQLMNRQTDRGAMLLVELPLKLEVT